MSKCYCLESLKSKRGSAKGKRSGSQPGDQGSSPCLRSKFQYIRKHWKLIYHLIVGTKHFGVNNKLWESFPSMFGVSIWKQLFRIITIKPLITNYKYTKWRAITLGFIHPSTAKMLWKNDTQAITTYPNKISKYVGGSLMVKRRVVAPVTRVRFPSVTP